jgi:hypothetical protein
MMDFQLHTLCSAKFYEQELGNHVEGSDCDLFYSDIAGFAWIEQENI